MNTRPAHAVLTAADTGVSVNTGWFADLLWFGLTMAFVVLAMMLVFAGTKMKVSKAVGFLAIALVGLIIASLGALAQTGFGANLLTTILN